jgi:hypothetical protein
MNLELTPVQTEVMKQALNEYWNQCQERMVHWQESMQSNKRLGMPDDHTQMLTCKRLRDEWHQRMTETHNLLRQLGG